MNFKSYKIHLKDMRTYGDEGLPLINLVEKIELVVSKRNLNKYYHRVEIERILFKLFNGEDILNPYERRDSGVDDYVWQNLIHEALMFLNLRGSYDKLYKK